MSTGRLCLTELIAAGVVVLVMTACGPTDPRTGSGDPMETPAGTDSASAAEGESEVDGAAQRFAFPVDSDATRYDPTHHDYPAADMFAECGTPVLAATDGTIEEVATVDEWDSVTDDPALRSGLMVSLVDDRGVRYYGSHLASVTVQPGERVSVGEQVGTVGDTGNAAGTGCHLHFGLSPTCRAGWENRRGLTAPQPFLDEWRSGGQADPLGAAMLLGCP